MRNGNFVRDAIELYGAAGSLSPCPRYKLCVARRLPHPSTCVPACGDAFYAVMQAHLHFRPGEPRDPCCPAGRSVCYSVCVIGPLQIKLTFPHRKEIYYPMRLLKDSVLCCDWAEKWILQLSVTNRLFHRTLKIFIFEPVILQKDFFRLVEWTIIIFLWGKPGFISKTVDLSCSFIAYISWQYMREHFYAHPWKTHGSFQPCRICICVAVRVFMFRNSSFFA